MSAYTSGRGLLGDNFQRPLRQFQTTTGQPLAAGGGPTVSNTTGLGIGGGASMGRDSGPAAGLVWCRVGLTPGTTGTVSIAFPNAIPAGRGPMLAFAEFASIVVGGGPLYTLTWTGTRPLVPGELVAIAYQWSNLT